MPMRVLAHTHTSLSGSSNWVCVLGVGVLAQVVNDQRSYGEEWGQGWVRLGSSFQRITIISLGRDKPLKKSAKQKFLVMPSSLISPAKLGRVEMSRLPTGLDEVRWGYLGPGFQGRGPTSSSSLRVVWSALGKLCR